ncbi:MAG: hypothetical protein HQ547_00875 [Candidatus Omnitrophica bacterium]|nr:hypothetical protein [Candidatus Omnitrophota bacterium]
MKFLVLFLIVFLITHSAVAQDVVAQTSPKYSEEAEEEIEIFIPKNLNECYEELEKVLDKEELNEFKATKEEDLVKYHFSIGRWIRNTWHLWGDAELKKYFNNMEIHHPDDMSGIIITSFHRYLNGKEIKLNEQIKYYKDYWDQMKKEKEKPQ